MDDLKKACLIVLDNNPGQYIQCILEYEDVYEFTMIDNGKEPFSIDHDPPDCLVLKNDKRFFF